MPHNSAMSPAVAIVFGIFWLLFMAGILITYIVILIAVWRGMKAHEKIAAKLCDIADKLQIK